MADLIAYTDLAAYLNVTFTANEIVVATPCCTAASDAVKSSAARSFEIQTAAQDRYFTYRRPFGVLLHGNYYGAIDWPVVYPSLFSTAIPPIMLEVDDFFLSGQTLNQITVSDTLSTTTYTPTQTWPFNAGTQGLPFEKLVFAAGTFLPLGTGQLKVNAKWGYVTAIPAGIKEIALLQAARFFKRKDAPFGVAGAEAMGNAMRLQSKLDPDVEVLLGSYRRWWAAA